MLARKADFDILCQVKQQNLRTAGAGGLETAACKLFSDDIVEIMRVVRATIANVAGLTALGGQPDLNGVGGAIFEMCLSRAVDRSLTYISNALHCVFRKHPEAAQAKETVDITFVLGFDTIGDLVDSLIERRVHELSYRSLNDLDAYFQKSMKFSLFASDEQRNHAVRLVAERNLIVHNRGVVNQIFRERISDSKVEVGDRVGYDGIAALREITFLLHWIADLDLRLIEKFGLASQPRTLRDRIEDV